MEHDTLRPEAPPSRRLVRTPNDRVVAGVCGGLGRYFDLDPVIFRIGFAVLTVAGGSGILLYALAWLAVPEDGRRSSIGNDLVRRTSHGPALGVILLAIAAIVIVSNLFDGGIGAAILLMAAGAALLVWKRDDEDEDPDDDPYHDRYDDPYDDRYDDTVSSSGFIRYRDDTRSSSTVPRSPRPRSYLGRLTVGLLLVMAGVFAGGHATGAFDASLEAFLAAALLLVGVALVVGARFGRARGLIPLGVVLVGLTAAASLVEVPLKGGIGERFYQPASTSEIRSEYRLLAGQLVIDLTRVEFGERVTAIDASVAAGVLKVVVPRDVDVDVAVEVAGGEVDVFGEVEDGVNVEVATIDDARGAGAEIELRLEVGGGRVEVARAAA